MKKKKKKQQQEPVQSLQSSNNGKVLIGIRVSESERQELKLYALRNNTTVTAIFRQYIKDILGKL